ncbi:MAG: MBOAT family protein [Lachnospiraceae bacterium]|nr:MBOAT family protein [Lachnospiraceae bacterium]
MVFSSLIFVLAFLPACLLFYYLMPTLSAKNVVLLLFSIIFYAWGGPLFVLIMLFDTVVCFFGARLIDKHRGTGKSKAALITTVALTLLVLGIFKYTDFFLSGVKLITGWPDKLPGIILPIGISFYTFQLITYVVDVYRGEVKVQKNFAWLLLYTAMFHQCIAGPIVRYKQISRELTWRKLTVERIYKGIVRFSIGLAKKAILANACASVADNLLASEKLAGASSAAIVTGILCYTLYIYLDFSAYSDMAIGMGLAMGFHLPENFNYPYISESITEFWRRWHMTLSSFFRDYVYIPLGGNRVGALRHILNLLIVWSLTGLWHGAHLNFVLWGVYYFVILVFEKYVLKNSKSTALKVIGHIYTPILFVIGWAIFRFTDLTELVTAFKGVFTLNGNRLYDKATYLLVKSNVFILLISFIACTPLYSRIVRKLTDAARNSGRAETLVIFWNTVFAIACLALSVMALIGNTYNPFLYFQF